MQKASVHFICSCGLFFFAALFFTAGALADSCTDCQTQRRINCSPRCDSSPDRMQYDKCVRDCVVPFCKQKCQNSAPDSTSSEVSEETCRMCLTKKLNEGCLDKCDRMSPRYDRCRKSCAKQRCAKQCSLPDAGFHNRPPRPKYACEQCKATAEIGCRGSMHCPPGPGEIACQFHCVSESCKSICLEEETEAEE